MVWTAPRTWVTDEIVTKALFNAEIRDNFIVVDQHGHSGAAGDGGTSLGSLVKETFTDAAAPAAPGAGKTVVYAVSGRPRYRTGAAGADTQLADASDLHTEDHASRHEPSGADAMAVDAVAATGSLRTLGTGAQQGAVGNHGHSFADLTAGTDDTDSLTGAGGSDDAGHLLDQIAASATKDTDLTHAPTTEVALVATATFVLQGHAQPADYTVSLWIDGTQVATSSGTVGIGSAATRHLSGMREKASGSYTVRARIVNTDAGDVLRGMALVHAYSVTAS